MRKLSWLLLLILIQFAPALEGLNEDGSLNKEAIQKLYFDGDFAKVVEVLESYRKANPNPSVDDKIFMYKHLSVVYAANPDTRVKGESFMYQLLKLVPTASLIDMYISDNIKAIFQNVKQEFEERQRYLTGKAGSDSTSTVKSGDKKSSNSDTKKQVKKKKSKAWIWWTAGGVAVAGGVVAFVLLSQEKEPLTLSPEN